MLRNLSWPPIGCPGGSAASHLPLAQVGPVNLFLEGEGGEDPVRHAGQALRHHEAGEPSHRRQFPAQPGHQASQLSASVLRVGFRPSQGIRLLSCRRQHFRPIRPAIRLLSCRLQLFASASGAGKAAWASGFSDVGVSSSRRLPAQPGHQASQLSASALRASRRPSQGIRLFNCRRRLFASAFGVGKADRPSHVRTKAIASYWRRLSAHPMRLSDTSLQTIGVSFRPIHEASRS